MENRLQLQQVEKELAAMKVLYPHCGFSGTAIRAVSRLYWQDCQNEGMSAQDFVDACSLARRNSKMFPTVGDIVRAHRDLMAGARVSRTTPALPPHISDEQAQRGQEWCQKILNEICRGKRVPKTGYARRSEKNG